MRTLTLLQWLGFVLLLVVTGTIVYNKIFTHKSTAIKTLVAKSLDKITGFGEFDYMTIDYLKNHNYPGSDIEIKEQLSKNSSYTSYLATYESDGLKINGLLTIPNSEKPEGGYPAIVFLHGYIPPTLYKTTEKYTQYVDYLAKNGFVVFKIDLRGNGQSEGEPSGAYYSADYIIDTLNAAASLQKHSDVNPEKIGIWGHSMAGNITLRAIAASNKLKAAVIWAGAVYTYEDMQQYGIDDNSYRPPEDTIQRTERQQKRQRMREKYGEPDLKSEFWSKVSPINYIDENTGKIQIHHAVNDTVVPVDYTRNLKNVLAEKDIEIETYEYQSGGHNLISPSFGIAMQRTVQFYEEHLKLQQLR